MAIPAQSLLATCQAAGEALGILEQGTATGGTAGTVVAAAYPFITNRSNASTKTYEGCEIRITDATNTAVVETREITGYAPSTGTFTVSANLTFTPAASDTFDIWKRGVRYEDVVNAVNRALRKRAYRTTLTLTPSGVVNNVVLPDWITTEGAIIGAYYNYNTSNTTDTDLLYPLYFWEVVAQQDDASNLFELRYYPASSEVITLKVWKPYAELATDTATTTMPKAWLDLATQVELLDMLRNKTPGQETNSWQRLYIEKAKKLVLLDKRYGQKPVLRYGFASPPVSAAWRF